MRNSKVSTGQSAEVPIENRGKRTRSMKVLGSTIIIVALGMAAYQLVSAYYDVVGSLEYRVVHLAFSMLLTFLVAKLCDVCAGDGYFQHCTHISVDKEEGVKFGF